MATIFLTDSLKSWTFLGAVMVAKALSISALGSEFLSLTCSIKNEK